MLYTCDLSHIGERGEKVPQYKLEELLLLLPIGFSMEPPLGFYVDRTLLLRTGLPKPIFSHTKFIMVSEPNSVFMRFSKFTTIKAANKLIYFMGNNLFFFRIWRNDFLAHYCLELANWWWSCPTKTVSFFTNLLCVGSVIGNVANSVCFIGTPPLLKYYFTLLQIANRCFISFVYWIHYLKTISSLLLLIQH